MGRELSPAAYVEAVCVVARVAPGYFHDTAIDKRLRDGPVEVTELGLVGDRQVDPSHGGPDAAVYVYASEDATWWAEQLGRDLSPGTFGENIRTSGLDVTGARIGERWRVGDVLLEVRKPRSPCENLSMRIGIERFHVDFHRSGRVGAKCRVLETGTIAADDPVLVEWRPEHDVTIGACATGIDPTAARALLESGLAVVPAIRARARRVVARADATPRAATTHRVGHDPPGSDRGGS